MKRLFIVTMLVIFVVLTVVLYALKGGFNFTVSESGNSIMALLSLVTYLIVTRQVEGSTQAFVRGVYSASFLKLMVCMISILVYVMLNRVHIHKPTVFMLFGIYAIYTIMETWLLSRVVKE